MHVAEYLTGLPSRQLLEQKLHEAVALSKVRLANRPGRDGSPVRKGTHSCELAMPVSPPRTRTTRHRSRH